MFAGMFVLYAGYETGNIANYISFYTIFTYPLAVIVSWVGWFAYRKFNYKNAFWLVNVPLVWIVILFLSFATPLTIEVVNSF